MVVASASGFPDSPPPNQRGPGVIPTPCSLAIRGVTWQSRLSGRPSSSPRPAHSARDRPPPRARAAPIQVPLVKVGPGNNISIPPATNQEISTTEIDEALLEGDADGGGDDDEGSGGGGVTRAIGGGHAGASVG